jgi:predicted N-acyltransferase
LHGSHKISRGYLPKATYSSHFIRNPTAAFHIRRHLQRSALETEASIEALKAQASPFKVNDADLEGVLHRLMSRAAEQAR